MSEQYPEEEVEGSDSENPQVVVEISAQEGEDSAEELDESDEELGDE